MGRRHRTTVPPSMELPFYKEPTSVLSPSDYSMASAPPMIVRLGTRRSNVHLEEEQNHGRSFVFLMLTANIAVFTWSMYLNDWQFEPLSRNPTLGPSSAVLDDLGAKNTAKILKGEWHRLFTPMFLHGGVVHIGLNMLMLVRLGGGMEECFGYFRIAIIYFASGVSGVLSSCVFLPSSLSVGASGALYGLIGALYGDFLHNWKVMVSGRACYLFQLLLNTAFGLAIGLLPALDNFAHVGGAISGFLIGSVILAMPNRDRSGRHSLPWYSDILKVLAAIAIVLWYGGLLWFLLFQKDAHQWCSFCKYASCIPTKWWSCSSFEINDIS